MPENFRENHRQINRTTPVADVTKALRVKIYFIILTVSGLNGLSLSGLTHTNTVYLAEQLYGAGFCHTYKFRYHSHELRKHDEVKVSYCIDCKTWITQTDSSILNEFEIHRVNI